MSDVGRENREKELATDRHRHPEIILAADVIGDVATKVRYFGTRGRLGYEADCGVFRQSGIRPRRFVISVPLSLVWFAPSPRLNTLRVPGSTG